MANPFESVWDFAKDTFSNVFGGGGPQRASAGSVQASTRFPSPGEMDLSRVNPGFAPPEYEGQKPLWLTGGDQQSPVNSWKSDFIGRMFKQQEELQAKGEGLKQFEKKDATGVVTWDHVGDNLKEYRFGDVFDNGKFLGNLYEDQEDQDLANLMMAQVSLNPDVMKQIGNDRDVSARLRAEMERFRKENTEMMQDAKSNTEFQKEVDKRQETITDWMGGEGSGLASAILGGIGGFAGGVAAGSLFGGIGAIPGAIVGTAIGGFSAYLNRDDVSREMATAYEAAKKAFEDDQTNLLGATGTAAVQASGLAVRSISPFSNLTRGLADPTRGNGVGAFQEEDVPSWARPMDIGVGVADAVFQFGLAPTRAIYMAQMSGHAWGRATELTVGGGVQWDPISGRMKSVYIDEDSGDVTVGRGLAAWGTAGIDFLQVGFARGLRSQIRGKDTTDVTNFDRAWLKGDAKTAAVKAEDIGPQRFFLDAEGKVVGRRLKQTAFVPSEGTVYLAATGAGRKAFNQAVGRMPKTAEARLLAEGKTPYAVGEDLNHYMYQAAQALSYQHNPFKAALVNGFGNGTEAATQAALEQISMDHRPTFQDIAISYGYGTAMGLGMTVGTNLNLAHQDSVQFEMAQAGYKRLMGTELSRDAYNRLSRADKRMYARESFDTKAQAQWDQYMEDQAKYGRPVEGFGEFTTLLFEQVANSNMQKKLERAGLKGEQAARIMAAAVHPVQVRTADGTPMVSETAYADDVRASDPAQIINNLIARENEQEANEQLIENKIARLEQQLSQAPADGQAPMQEQLTRENEKLATLREVGGALTVVREAAQEFDARLQKLGNHQLEEKRQVVIEANQFFENAWRGKPIINQQTGEVYHEGGIALRMAASSMRLRSPLSSAGSVSIYGLAFDWMAVKEDRKSGYVLEPLTGLEKIEADFDGDRSNSSLSLILHPEVFQRQANGFNLINTDGGRTRWQMSTMEHDAASLRNIYHTLKGDFRLVKPEVAEAVLDNFVNTLQTRYGLSNKVTKQVRSSVNELFKGERNSVIDFAEEGISLLSTALLSIPDLNTAIHQAAEENNTNEPEIVVALFRSYLADFSRQLDATALFRNGGPQTRANQIQLSQKVPHGAQVGSIALETTFAAATALEGLFWASGSDSMLRTGGEIKYSETFYNDVNAQGEPDKDLLVARLASNMRELATESLNEGSSRAPDTFDISGRVLRMARQMVAGNILHNENYDLAVFQLLTARAHEYARNDSGELRFTGRDVSVAQMLVSEVIADIRRSAGHILQRNQDLSRRLSFLENAAREERSREGKMSSGEMTLLLEGIGGLSLTDLAGVDVAAEYGLIENGTISQHLAKIWTMPPEDRSTLYKQLKDPSFAGGNAILAQVRDILVEASSATFSRDSQGNPTGRIADSNSRGSEAYRENVKSLQEALKAHQVRMDVSGRKQSKREAFHDFLLSYEGPALKFFESLLSGTGMGAFVRAKDGTVSMQDWVIEALLEPDTQKGEMMLWRGRAEAGLRKYESEVKEDPKRVPEDTAVALLYYLKYEADPIVRDKVFLEFNKDGQTREGFERYMGTQADFQFAPVLMFENVMETFEATQPKGGWGNPSMSLRQELAEHGDWLSGLPKKESERDQLIRGTVAFAETLEPIVQRAIERNDSSDPQAQAFLNLIDNYFGRNLVATDAGTSIEAITEALSDVSTNMHVKGDIMSALAGLSTAPWLNSLRSGHTDPASEGLEVLLESVDLQDVRERPELLLQAKRVIDENGALVEDLADMRMSDGLTPDPIGILRKFKNPKLVPILTEMLLPKVTSYDFSTGVERVGYLGPNTLENAVSRSWDMAFEIDPATKSYTREADFIFGSMVSAEVQRNNPDEINSFLKEVAKLTVARMTSGESRTLSKEEINKIAIESWRDTAQAFRNTALYIASHNGTSQATPTAPQLAVRQDVLNDMVNAAKSRQREDAASQYQTRKDTFGYLRQEMKHPGSLLNSEVREWLNLHMEEAEFEARSDAVDRLLTAQETLESSPTDKQALADRAKAIADLRKQSSSPNVFNMFLAISNNDVVGYYKSRYLIEEGTLKTSSLDKLQEVRDYLDNNMSLMERTSDARRAIFTKYYNENTRDTLTEGEWIELSQAVILDRLDRESILPGSTLRKLPRWPADERLLDPTYAQMLDQFSDVESPLLAASLSLVKVSGLEKLEFPSRERTITSLTKLYNSSKVSLWASHIPGVSSAIDSALSSTTIDTAPTMAGDNSKNQHALSMASRRTYERPPEEFMVDVVVNRTRNNGMKITDSPFDVDVLDLEGAFAQIFDASGQEIFFDGITFNQGTEVTMQAVTQDIVENLLKRHGGPLTVRMYHPQHRPPGADWFNNIYFDGIIAHNSANVAKYDSIVSEGFFGVNGINVRAQRRVLDAIKKRINAIHAMRSTESVELSDSSSIHQYMSKLANAFIEMDMGFGKGDAAKLGRAYYKFALKLFYMRHVVRYADGTVVPVAEHVFNLNNPSEVDVNGAELIALSRRQANTLYGEIGNKGLSMGFAQREGLSTEGYVFSFDNLTPRAARMLERLGTTVKLENTRIAQNRNPVQTVHATTKQLIDSASESLTEYLRLVEARADNAAHRRRYFKEHDLNIGAVRHGVVTRMNTLLENDRAVAANARNLEQHEMGGELEKTAAYSDRAGATETSFGVLYSDSHDGDYHNGELSRGNFDAYVRNIRPSFGDFVVVDLSAIEHADSAITNISKLAALGKEVVFLGRDIKDIRQKIIRNIAGTHEARTDAPHAWAPKAALAGSRYESAALMQSRAAQQMTSSSRLWTFYAYAGESFFHGLEENQAYGIDAGGSISISTNISRKNSSPFLAPAANSEVNIRNLRDMLEDKTIWGDALTNAKDSRVDTLTLTEARRDLLDRLDAGQLDLATVGTELKLGMFSVHKVQLEDPDYGERVSYYLHRTGSGWISDADLKAAFRAGRNLIIGPEKINENETFTPGVVEGKGPTSSIGMQKIFVRAKLQDVANKLISGTGEGGIKLMMKNAPEALQKMLTPLFKYADGDTTAESGAMQILAFIGDVWSKQNFNHAVTNYREAAAVLGFDNMPIFYQGAYGEVLPENVKDRTAEQRRKYDALKDLLEAVSKSPSISEMEAEEAIAALSGKSKISEGLFGLSFAEYVVDSSILRDRLEMLEQQGAQDAASNVFLAALIHLSAPGASLAEIQGARGFMEHGDNAHGAASHRIPQRFAQIFSDGPQRELAIDMFNLRLNKQGAGQGSWTLDSNYDLILETTDENGDPAVIRGVLARPVYSAVGEQAALPRKADAKKGVSTHDNRLLEAAVGSPQTDKFRSEVFSRQIEEQMLNEAEFENPMHILESEGSTAKQRPRPWHVRGWAEQIFKARARKYLISFYSTIDLQAHGETDAEVAQITSEIQRVAERLFGSKDIEYKIHYMHYLLRLRMGRPGADAKANADEIAAAKVTHKQIRESLKATEEALDAGRSPLYRGVVNLIPFEILRAIYTGQQGRSNPWQPRIWTEKRSGIERAETLNDYVLATFNDVLGDYGAMNFDAANLAVDAAYHTYMDSVPDSRGNPVSLNLMNDLLLLSENNRFEVQLEKALEGNMLFSEYVKENPGAVPVSLNRFTQLMLTPESMHDLPSSTTVARWIGSKALEPLLNPNPITEKERQRAVARWNNWQAENDIPYSTETSAVVALNSINTVQDRKGVGHPAIRTILGVRAALALLNPALMAASLVEATWKRSIQDTRKMITGESTGFLSIHLNKVVERALEQQNKAEAEGSRSYVGILARGIGYMPMYTAEQAQLKRRIVKTSAASKELQDMIHDALDTYRNELTMTGVPALVRKAGEIGSAMQDLARGTRANTLTNTYVDAFVAYAVNQQGHSMDLILAGMGGRPADMARMFPQAHRAGLEAMNDIRATQKTVLGKMIQGVYKPMTSSGNAGINAFGHLFFAMPLMFSNYAANFLLTATGLRGIDQLAAHALQGRQKPGSFFSQLSAKARGEEVSIKDSDLQNMDDVIGSLDAMDSVINMGVTHSQLFLAGIILQGLGLTGEDEETKRRRRAARLGNGPFLYDPRKIENDFRNADAIFLDWLPGPLAQLFATVDDEGNKRSYAQVHWTMQQVFLPMLGMERFFETGDIRHVWWGFTDAIGAMPLVNTMMLDRGLTMTSELTKAAADADATGGPDSLQDTIGFLGTMVATFESMMFESSFLNQIYIGLDEYDRDPYILPLRDSDGDLQRDAFGEVRANRSQRMRSDGLDGRGVALETFFDADGQMQRGYASQSRAEIQSRVMAKNRLSYAVVSSLFTGISGKGSNLRYNMPVKTRTFDKPEMTEAEQKAVVLGGLRSNAAYMTYLNEALEKTSPAEKQQAAAVALSFLDDEGDEVLSNEGAMAIYRGIAGGSVPFGSEALAGVYIDFETRQKIASEWMDELAQKAVDMGLPERTAKYIATQAFKGPQDGTTPGFSDLLWSDQIPYGKTQKYQQLNTTYVMGPDGNPWATGFTRTKLLGALGLTPLLRPYTSEDTGLMHDARGNTLDPLLGINTGHRALKRMDDSWNTPTDAEIGDAIVKAIEDLDLKSFSPGGRRGYGGGGGGGYGIRPQYRRSPDSRWNRLNLRAQVFDPARVDEVRAPRTDNITLRRATIRKQRFSSERGRLNEWQ